MWLTGWQRSVSNAVTPKVEAAVRSAVATHVEALPQQVSGGEPGRRHSRHSSRLQGHEEVLTGYNPPVMMLDASRSTRALRVRARS